MTAINTEVLAGISTAGATSSEAATAKGDGAPSKGRSFAKVLEQQQAASEPGPDAEDEAGAVTAAWIAASLLLASGASGLQEVPASQVADEEIGATDSTAVQADVSEMAASLGVMPPASPTVPLAVEAELGTPQSEGLIAAADEPAGAAVAAAVARAPAQVVSPEGPRQQTPAAPEAPAALPQGELAGSGNPARPNAGEATAGAVLESASESSRVAKAPPVEVATDVSASSRPVGDEPKMPRENQTPATRAARAASAAIEPSTGMRSVARPMADAVQAPPRSRVASDTSTNSAGATGGVEQRAQPLATATKISAPPLSAAPQKASELPPPPSAPDAPSMRQAQPMPQPRGSLQTGTAPIEQPGIFDARATNAQHHVSEKRVAARAADASAPKGAPALDEQPPSRATESEPAVAPEPERVASSQAGRDIGKDEQVHRENARTQADDEQGALLTDSGTGGSNDSQPDSRNDTPARPDVTSESPESTVTRETAPDLAALDALPIATEPLPSISTTSPSEPAPPPSASQRASESLSESVGEALELEIPELGDIEINVVAREDGGYELVIVSAESSRPLLEQHRDKILAIAQERASGSADVSLELQTRSDADTSGRHDPHARERERERPDALLLSTRARLGAARARAGAPRSLIDEVV